MKILLSDVSPEEKRWIKHQVYHQMDSFYKMHMLDREKDILMRFISIPSDSTLSIDTINLIEKRTIGDARVDVNMYNHYRIQGSG